jgi:hypothetical protein
MIDRLLNSWPTQLDLAQATLTLCGSQFISWLGDLVRSMFPWPIIVIASLAYLAASPRSSARLAAFLRSFGPFKSIKLFNFEVEMNADSRRKVENAAAEIKDLLKTYRVKLNDEVAPITLHEDLRVGVGEFILTVVSPLLLKNAEPDETFRCTFHIRDPIFDDYLLQLMNYYPNGGGAGRIFSARRGIIGKVWRSRTPLIEGHLLDEKDSELPRAEQLRIIELNWGMTNEEARKSIERPSYVAIPLMAGAKRLGILYMDSSKRDQFGPSLSGRDSVVKGAEDSRVVALRDGLKQLQLLETLEQISKRLGKLSPTISLTGEE